MARSQLLLRVATFLTGLLECIAFSGLIFGWTSLVFVLKSDHYFQDLCEQPLNLTGNATGKAECSAQDSKFSLIFTLASFANNFMIFPTGYIFDRLGTTVARLIAIFLYTGATLLVAISSAGTAPMLFAAFPMLAVGGILFLLTNLQVGNLFGKHRSTIITLYNGAFDSSSAIFLIIKLLYERGLPLRVSFFILCAFSIFHLIRTFFLMPRGHIPYPVPSNYTYGISCSRGANGSQGTKGGVRKEEEELRQEVTPSPTLQESSGAEQVSFRSCILSWRFFWHLVWMSVMQLWHYLFIGTLNPMLNQLSNGNQDHVSSFTNAFAITQLFGVLCAPWNFPVWRKCCLHHSGFSFPAFWEDLRDSDDAVSTSHNSTVPHFHPHQRATPGEPSICKYCADIVHSSLLCPSFLGVKGVASPGKTCLMFYASMLPLLPAQGFMVV